MSTETNKTIARQFREEVYTKGNLEILDQICDSQVTIRNHDPLTPDFGRGPQALKQVATMYRTAFPDANCTVDEVIAEGDKIVVRWTGRGTNNGALGTNPPTHKKVTVTGVDILKVANGKIAECDTIYDAAGMLQQLGLTQPMKQAAK